MKSLNLIYVLCITILLVLASCQKENIDDIVPEEPHHSIDTITVNPIMSDLRSSSSDFITIECLSIPYPVTFLQQSGETITVSSEMEFEEAQMLADTLVNFVYPIEATDDSGTSVTIEGIEDLVIQITFCDMGETDCLDADAHVLLFFNGLDILTINKYVYTINYPVTLIVEGNQVVLNTDEEYLPAIGGSPFDYLSTELVYPITITQFGQDIILESDVDVCDFYATLDEPCENKPAHIQFFFNQGVGTAVSCAYLADYPITITTNSGNVALQTSQEYLDILNGSSTAYDDIQLVYPVSLTKLDNGQQVVCNSDGDICEYLENCQ